MDIDIINPSDREKAKKIAVRYWPGLSFPITRLIWCIGKAGTGMGQEIKNIVS